MRREAPRRSVLAGKAFLLQSPRSVSPCSLPEGCTAPSRAGWPRPQAGTALRVSLLRVAPASGWLRIRGKAPGRFQGSWAVEPSALPGGRADSAAVNNLERARGSRGAARDVSVGLCGWGAPGEHPRGASQPPLPITQGLLFILMPLEPGLELLRPRQVSNDLNF